MKIKIKKSIGGEGYQFEIDKDDPKKALFLAGSIASMPESCGECGGNNLTLDANIARTDDGTYEYVKVRCKDCGAQSTMGEYKQEKGIFWKEFEKFQGDSQQTPSQ